MPDISHPTIALFMILLVGGIAFAGILGGAPERFGALTLISMAAIQALLYNTVGRPEYGSVDWVALAVDLFAFGALTLIAMNADRFWPIIAAGFQLISLVAHSMRSVTDMLGVSYAHFKSGQTLFVIVVLIIGTMAHLYRLRRYGADRAWFPYRKYAEFRSIADKAEL